MKRSGKMAVRRVPVAAVGRDTIDEMWTLYAAHYDHVERSAFERDLAEKTLVFVARDTGSGELVGFSTALRYEHVYRGEAVMIYFSGDTMIHPDYWGQRALHVACLRQLVAWKLRHPFRRLYWYLICSGFKTYLSLVRNVPEHWPRYERPTPEWEAGLIDSISRERYPDAWDRARGVISTGGSQVHLQHALVPLTPAMRALPEIQFFTTINPGCSAGDELAMIGRVDARLFLKVVGKLARRFLAHLPSKPVRALPRPAHRAPSLPALVAASHGGAAGTTADA